jgi:hypothetical protein
MYRARIGALGVALALGAAGCGGSDALTRAGFVKRADAICMRAKETARKHMPRGPAGVPAAYAAYQREKEIGIGALTPPEQLQEQLGRYMNAVQARGTFFTRYASAIRAHERVEGVGRKTEELRNGEERLARQLHLHGCLD